MNLKNDPILVSNPKANYLSHQDEIDKAIRTVLLSGWYILGEQVKKFEEEFAKYLGTFCCIGVACGTDALSLALKAVGVDSGDEVITVSHTAVATVAAIEIVGAVPVFVDIDPLTFCMDANKIENVITKRTKAILPVHIYGQPANMIEIMELAKAFNLKVVEDCAQAIGAKIGEKYVGTFGHAAVFSFYPTKNLGAIGDGGLVVTNNEDTAEIVTQLREYGWNKKRVCTRTGYCSRLDEIQAAILRVKLSYLPEDNVKRREIAKKYYKVINNTQIVPQLENKKNLHAMHLFVVRCNKREQLQVFLSKRGINTAIHYPKAVHQQPVYVNRIRGSDNLEHTEQLCNCILTLPMYPEMKDDQVERICLALLEWISLSSSNRNFRLKG